MRHLATLSLLLVGCAAQPPSVEGQTEASIPAVAPAVPRASRQVIRTTWDFEAGPEQCVAVAAAGRTSLRVTVRRNAAIQMTVSLPGPLPPGRSAPMALRFNGPAGSWQVSARPVGSRQLTAALGSDETALSRVLVLLSGGVLEIGEQERAIPSLALAPSETRGRTWFDCARETTT
jgi:hypothetical protein